MQTIKARSSERAIINQPNQFRAVARLFATANQESPDFGSAKISNIRPIIFISSLAALQAFDRPHSSNIANATSLGITEGGPVYLTDLPPSAAIIMM
mmetsp:Transcript_23915/g.57681  ORF Transcript_23915/g.57681 Transcript_23915/m.57681 type:complete len:97 (+) Transcript_23915:572-862(+)